MASASSSAQAAFGLGRRKKNPGLLDQIGKFFGGDKKRKSKVRREGPSLPHPPARPPPFWFDRFSAFKFQRRSRDPVPFHFCSRSDGTLASLPGQNRLAPSLPAPLGPV